MATVYYKACFELINRAQYTVVKTGNCGHRHRSLFAAMKCEDKYIDSHSKIQDGLIQNTWCEKTK